MMREQLSNDRSDKVTFSMSHYPATNAEPLREISVGALLRDVVAQTPSNLALTEGAVGEGRTWTYAELLEVSERVAAMLLQQFEQNERVAVWGHNLPEWVVLEYACALAGLTLVTVNPTFRPFELRYVLEQSAASGVVAVSTDRDQRLLDIAQGVAGDVPSVREVLALDGICDWAASASAGRRLLPDVAPDAIAQIQFTSGTTGRPKGALLRHRSIVNNAWLYARRAGFTPAGTFLNPMPLFHTGGCVCCTLGPLSLGMNVVLPPAFDPDGVLSLLETNHVTDAGMVPAMLVAMLEHPHLAATDLSAWRVVTCGGATVPADLVRRVEAELGVRVSNTFGQTEASPVISQTYLDDSLEDKTETIGRPLEHAEIVDSEGHVVPVGVPGEICVRGYQVMAGYEAMPVETAAAIDADGFLHTGDLGVMDERGYLSIAGRLKDMIIRGGENIYPRETEDRLFEHSSIGEVAVIGTPDERLGETVVAVLRLVAGAAEPPVLELRAWCRQTLAPFKTPAQWFAVDQFPVTASGKVKKFELASSSRRASCGGSSDGTEV